MCEGHIIYHGPRESVLPYFAGIGYSKPEDKDTADFLQEVPTSHLTVNLVPRFGRSIRAAGVAQRCVPCAGRHVGGRALSHYGLPRCLGSPISAALVGDDVGRLRR